MDGKKLNNYSPDGGVTSLSYKDIVVGTGDVANADSTITAHYTGALASDGTIFQSSHTNGQPFTSSLSSLVQGWQQGIPGMKVGGTRRLVIPASLAYGAATKPGIPANSDLVFDIELLAIQ